MDARGPGLLRGSEASAVSSELPFLRDTWHLRTHPQAGNGSGAVGLVRWSPDSRGPAAQLFGAQLRITTRVLASCSRSRYPCNRVPTVAPGPTSGEATNPQVRPLL